MSAALVELQGVTKVYRLGEVEVPALRGVDLAVRPGDFLALMGPSGSGKSTLLHLLGLLDRPTAGRVLWEGADVTRLNGARLAELRGRRIGFVFQMFNLVPNLTALENVELPLVFLGVPWRERRQRARAVLERLGLGDRLRHRPNQLSGGQQQRVALARALVTDPALLLADEPTGNLDSATGREILALLAELNRQGRTIVLATHDPEAAAVAQARLRLRDGRIVEVA
ncbi:MAG: ABC transporter ATP-binding protein [Candidatus Bipolaricaulota bacterium]|nr:ABC transporter ATP-binding protein [Candidatus Bipolaricaulota bacterium]MDW8152251.1 ABC transporter ATP-binding protein [Candidatus Bipolaricaulota bacterium]